MLSFSCKAPVGQACIHWPQNVQFTSFKLLSPTVEIQDLNPRLIQSIAPTFWTFLQAAIHLLHKIHLLKSLTIDGDTLSILCSVLSPSNSIFWILNFVQSSCNSQFPWPCTS